MSIPRLKWANHLVVWCRDVDPKKLNKKQDLKEIKCWDTPISIWKHFEKHVIWWFEVSWHWKFSMSKYLTCLHQTTWVIEQNDPPQSHSTSTSHIEGVRLAMTQLKRTCTQSKIYPRTIIMHNLPKTFMGMKHVAKPPASPHQNFEQLFHFCWCQLEVTKWCHCLKNKMAEHHDMWSQTIQTMKIIVRMISNTSKQS